MREIRMRRPDDMHLHLRSGQMLGNVLPFTARLFQRGVVMGNLPRPVVTADDAEAYREEILTANPGFQPMMTIMLTRQTTPEIVRGAFGRGVKVLKYIPNNVSTNSEEGVALSELSDFYPVLEEAQELGVVLSGHWESPLNSNGTLVAEAEREIQAIRFLSGVIRLFPGLRMVVEHATTEEMINFVKEAPATVGATLTVHHALLINSDVCDGKGKIINPYNYCKPIAKNPQDREAVVRAMMSGNPKFFFGSDSAPHLVGAKKKTPPAAGIFSAPVALPLLCQLFEQNNALEKLENFISRFGAEFYGLSLNSGEIVLRKETWVVPEEICGVPVFWGGNELRWQ